MIFKFIKAIKRKTGKKNNCIWSVKQTPVFPQTKRSRLKND